MISVIMQSIYANQNDYLSQPVNTLIVENSSWFGLEHKKCYVKSLTTPQQQSGVGRVKAKGRLRWMNLSLYVRQKRHYNNMEKKFSKNWALLMPAKPYTGYK
jgi:hypothetical protein